MKKILPTIVIVLLVFFSTAGSISATSHTASPSPAASAAPSASPTGTSTVGTSPQRHL